MRVRGKDIFSLHHLAMLTLEHLSVPQHITFHAAGFFDRLPSFIEPAESHYFGRVVVVSIGRADIGIPVDH